MAWVALTLTIMGIVLAVALAVMDIIMIVVLIKGTECDYYHPER